MSASPQKQTDEGLEQLGTRDTSSSLTAESITWEEEQLVRVQNAIFRIKQIDPKDQKTERFAELEHYKTKERRRIKVASLDQLRPGIDCSVIPEPESGVAMVKLLTDDAEIHSMLDKLPSTDASKAAMDRLLLRVRWLRALHKRGYRDFRPCDLTELDIAHIAKTEELPVMSAKSLAFWETGSQDAARLIPNYEMRGGANGSRSDATSRTLLAQVIIDARDEKTCIELRPTEVLGEHRARIDQMNKEPERLHPVPYLSLATVTRDFNKFVSPYERDVARYGKKRADRMHTPTTRRPLIEFAGGTTEFDDLDTGIFCVDEKTGLPWGHPWLTQGVDSATDYLCGCHLDTQPRSAISAVKALVNSIEAKNPSQYGEELEGTVWPASGYPVGVRFDNQLYNNERIVTMCADVADAEWAQPYTPTQKRTVEYTNGLTMKWFRSLPGTRGAEDDPEAIKEGLSSAIFDADKLRALHLYWALNKLMRKPMKDGLTREQKYLEHGGLALRSRIPPDTRRLRMLSMWRFPEPVKWGPNGVRVLNLTFNHKEAYRKWINRAGGSMMVEAAIDPDNLNNLYIFIPDSNKVLELPCLESEYVKHLNLVQQRLIVKKCAELKRRNPSLSDMYFASHQLRLMTEQLRRSGKVRARRQAVRTGDLPEAHTTKAISDLENAVNELSLVEAEVSSEGYKFPSFEDINRAQVSKA